MTPSIPGDGHSPNRKLYRDGRRYLRDLPPWEQVKYETAELKPIAQKCATSVQEVNAALGFVAAVDQIADVAGATAKKLLLSGENVLLTPALVRKIAQRSQSSVQAAMRQAANGLHPLAPLIPVGKPPELALWDYDFDRLGFALNLLQGSNSARLYSARLRLAELPNDSRIATAWLETH